MIWRAIREMRPMDYLTAIIIAAIVCCVLFILSGCIPVHVRPEQSENGKPIPLAVVPVAPVPAVADPAWDSPTAKPAASDWMSALLAALGIAGAVGGTGALGWAARAVGRYRSALKIVTDLAEDLEDPNTDAGLAKQVAQKRQYIITGFRIEIARGFIGKQQGRVIEQSPGDRHALLFATRQLKWHGGFFRRQTDFRKNSIGACLHGFLLGPTGCL